MNVKSKDLKPGDRVRSTTEAAFVRTLAARLSDDSGWRLTNNGWLADASLDRGDWTLVTPEQPQAPEQPTPVDMAHWVIEYSQPVPGRTYAANRTRDVICATAERAIELFRAGPGADTATIHVVRKVSRDTVKLIVDWEAIPRD